jgi:hypothetical protein
MASDFGKIAVDSWLALLIARFQSDIAVTGSAADFTIGLPQWAK